MSTLKERVIEALTLAKQQGHDVAAIAKRCDISVQAVYAWENPDVPLKGIKGDSLSGLSKLSGLSPWYINDGEGDKVLYYAKNEYQKNTLSVMEPMDIKDQAKMPGIGHVISEQKKNSNEM